VDAAGASDAGRNVRKERIGELFFHRLDLLGPQSGQQTADPARDIETDPSGGYHTTLICIEGGHTADRKAITPMPIGHDIACLHDPWKRCNVGCLLAHLVVHALEQRPVGVEDHRSAHLACGGELPLVFRNLLKRSDVHRDS